MSAADMPELVRAILPGSPPCAARPSANALTVAASLPRVANGTPRLSSIGLTCPPGAAVGLRPHAMTEQPAQGQDGRTWPPGFAAGAEHRWSDAETACDLIETNAQRTD